MFRGRGRGSVSLLGQPRWRLRDRDQPHGRWRRFAGQERCVASTRLFVSQPEVALFEPSKPQLQMVGDVFENDWEGFFDCPSEQRLKSGSDEGQGARRVGVADQAFVFAPLRVAFPVAGFAAPMGANDRRQALRARFGFSQAADEMTNEYFVLLKGLDLGLGFRTGQLGLIGIIGLRCGGGWVDRRLGPWCRCSGQALCRSFRCAP